LLRGEGRRWGGGPRGARKTAPTAAYLGTESTRDNLWTISNAMQGFEIKERKALEEGHVGGIYPIIVTQAPGLKSMSTLNLNRFEERGKNRGRDGDRGS